MNPPGMDGACRNGDNRGMSSLRLALCLAVLLASAPIPAAADTAFPDCLKTLRNKALQPVARKTPKEIHGQ